MTPAPRPPVEAALARAFVSALRDDLRLNLDAVERVQSPDDAGSLAAVRTLGALVAETAPQESEVFFSIGPPGARLARVGHVVLVARWQVRGDRSPAGDAPTPIRPGALGPEELVDAPAARAVVRGFEGAGWTVTIAPMPEAEEVGVRAERTGPEAGASGGDGRGYAPGEIPL